MSHMCSEAVGLVCAGLRAAPALLWEGRALAVRAPSARGPALPLSRAQGALGPVRASSCEA